TAQDGRASRALGSNSVLGQRLDGNIRSRVARRAHNANGRDLGKQELVQLLAHAACLLLSSPRRRPAPVAHQGDAADAGTITMSVALVHAAGVERVLGPSAD